MSEKFQINRDKLNDIVNKYNQETQGKNDAEKESIQSKYIELVINELGTETLREAISYDVLEYTAKNMLEGNLMHTSYSNEESLRMIEGLSNYEIVGDWQHFLTVEPQYLFELPKNMQKVFAENFAIGNNDASECLLTLWENHIETTGTDVIREESPGSTNCITMQCHAPDVRFMLETLRKKNTSRKYIFATLY